MHSLADIKWESDPSFAMHGTIKTAFIMHDIIVCAEV